MCEHKQRKEMRELIGVDEETKWDFSQLGVKAKEFKIEGMTKLNAEKDRANRNEKFTPVFV